MPPRGPITITRSQAESLIGDLTGTSWEPTLLPRLQLALGESGDHITIVIKDDEAEGILDLLEPTNPVRSVVSKALVVMKQG